MQKAGGPGDIPEWKAHVMRMTPFQRGVFAQKLGITDRTAFNWSNGLTEPTDSMKERITKLIKRGKK